MFLIKPIAFANKKNCVRPDAILHFSRPFKQVLRAIVKKSGWARERRFHSRPNAKSSPAAVDSVYSHGTILGPSSST